MNKFSLTSLSLSLSLICSALCFSPELLAESKKYDIVPEDSVNASVVSISNANEKNSAKNKKKYRYKQSDFQQHNKEKASEIAKNINLNRANLLELYQLALQSNPTWLAAQADALALKEKVPQALGQLLPNISASGVHNKTNTTQKPTQTYNGKKIHPKNNYVYDSYNYALTGRQAIFRPYNFALYKQAKNEANRADAMIEQALQDLAVSVSTAYFDVLLAKADLDVCEQQKRSFLEHKNYAEKAFDAGLGTKTDIDEATSRYDMENARSVELRYRLEYTLDALEAVVGADIRGVNSLDPNKIKLQRPTPAKLDAWITRAEEVNPTLKAMQSNVKAANDEVLKAYSGHLPTVDLVAQVSRSKSDTSSTINTAYETSFVGLQVSVPIYSGGATQSTVRQAKYSLTNQEERFNATKREISLQVRKEFDASMQGVDWIIAYSTALDSAERALNSTKKGFEAGTRNRLDILNAESNLSQAKLNLNRGRYQYVIARIRLLALVNQLDLEQIQYFNSWLEGK